MASKKKAAPKKKPAKPAKKKAAPAKKKAAPAKKAAPKKKIWKASDIKPSTGIKPVEKPDSAPASPDFLALVEVFTERPGVTRARMMGCEGLRVAGKYFAYEWRGELVVKLPRDTVDSYVASGHGRPFDPGMGRPMKEWLTVPPGHADWRNLAEQAFDFVAASL
jgi:hypothetical protein